MVAQAVAAAAGHVTEETHSTKIADEMKKGGQENGKEADVESISEDVDDQTMPVEVVADTAELEGADSGLLAAEAEASARERVALRNGGA